MTSGPLTTVLIVGLGSMGRRYAKILHAFYPNVKLIALRHQNHSSTLDTSLGITQCVTSLEDAISFGPDIAIIANPATFHLDVAIPLANAGVHLLIEKPLSATTNAVEQLIQVADKNDCRLMTAYNLRFLPSLEYFRKLLDGKNIGTLLSVRMDVGQYLPQWRPDTDYRNSVSAKRSLGGGVLLELSHEIDLLLWLFGSVNWVFASLSKHSNLQIDVEDTAHLLLGIEKPTNGSLLVASLNMDFIRQDTTRRCIAIGEKGTLKWDAVTGTVEIFHQDRKEWKTLFADKPEKDFTYRQELQHFMTCIAKKQDPMVDGRAGLTVLRVIEAARRSSMGGKRVTITKA